MATNNKKYHAFISYRHADNKEQGRQWATWIHQAIETYEVPADLVGTKNGRGEEIPPRIYPIFRDEEELPADADLGKAITNALDSTRLLIVLCSPRAVASTYVAEEIDYFKKCGNSDKIIAAMIDGEPNTSWDKGKLKTGFTAEDECFPIPLQFEYDQQGNKTTKHAEPIAADFRINNNGIPEQGWTSIEAYRQHLKSTTKLDNKQIQNKLDTYQKQQNLMLLKIIAGILGVPLSELTQRDKAYQLEQANNRAKKLRRWLTGVFLLAVIAIGAGIFAYYKQQEAVEQRSIAEQNEKNANNLRIKAAKNHQQVLKSKKTIETNQLVKLAENELLTGNPEAALILSLAALPGEYGGDRPYVFNLEKVIVGSLSKIKHSENIYKKKAQPGMSISQFYSFNYNQTSVVELYNITGNDNQVIIIDNINKSSSTIENAALISASNEFVLIATKGNKYIYNTQSHEFIWDFKNPKYLMTLSKDGTMLAMKSEDKLVSIELSKILSEFSETELLNVDWTDTELLETFSTLINLEVPKYQKTKYLQVNRSVGYMEYSKDNSLLVVGTIDVNTPNGSDEYGHSSSRIEPAYLEIYDTISGKSLHRIVNEDYSIFHISVSPDSKWIGLSCSDNKLRVLNVETNEMFSHPHLNDVVYSAFSPSSKYIVSNSTDRIATIINLNEMRIHCDSLINNLALLNSSFSKDENYLISTTPKEIITWDVNSCKAISKLSIAEKYTSQISEFISATVKDNNKIYAVNTDSIIKANLLGSDGIKFNSNISSINSGILTNIVINTRGAFSKS